MNYRWLIVVLVAGSSVGCGGSSWLKMPSNPFATQEKQPATVAEMLARESTASSTPKQEPSAKKNDKQTRNETANFLERFSNARSNEQAGKLDMARDMYQKLIVDFSARPEPYHRLGVVADRQQRHREAQSLYTQALQRKPLDAEIFNDLGYCFFLQGKLSKSESALMKAVSLNPSDERVRNNLGMVLAHLGRDEEALEQFRHAGSEADAQFNVAFVQVSRGNVEEATRRLELALLSDPTFEKARLALEDFHDMEQAEQDGVANIAQLDSVDPPKSGRYVPYLEDAGPAQPNAALTGGSEAIEVVGEGDTTMHSSQHFGGSFGSNNAAARSLESANLGEFDSTTQSLQAQAHAMMQSRLQK